MEVMERDMEDMEMRLASRAGLTARLAQRPWPSMGPEGSSMLSMVTV
jgi:hypothetical protein